MKLVLGLINNTYIVSSPWTQSLLLSLMCIMSTLSTTLLYILQSTCTLTCTTVQYFISYSGVSPGVYSVHVHNIFTIL